MSQLTQSLRSDRYLGCPITTLGPATLVEIGRVMTHYGLLVARVREFVSYVASQSQRLPPSIGSKESIKLLPSVMEMVKPAFNGDDRKLLQQALDRVTMARETIDRFHYSNWGTLQDDHEGWRCARTEYRRYKGGGCWRDQSIYTVNDLHELAMEISLAMKYLGKVQGVLQQQISEKSHALRKKINRKRI